MSVESSPFSYAMAFSKPDLILSKMLISMLPKKETNIKKVVANHVKFATTGTAEGIRTPDLLVRSQSLYPTELQPHFPRFTQHSVERYASITQEK